MRSCFAAFVVLAAAGTTFAQPRPPMAPARPTVSPYLNLLVGGSGSSPALNYFGLVRPQQMLYQQTNQLQQQVAANSQAIQNTNASMNGADPYLPATGRGAAFGYYSHYYPSLGGGGGIGGGAGMFGGSRPGGGFQTPAFAANRGGSGSSGGARPAAGGRR